MSIKFDSKTFKKSIHYKLFYDNVYDKLSEFECDMTSSEKIKLRIMKKKMHY